MRSSSRSSSGAGESALEWAGDHMGRNETPQCEPYLFGAGLNIRL